MAASAQNSNCAKSFGKSKCFKDNQKFFVFLFENQMKSSAKKSQMFLAFLTDVAGG